MTCLKPGTAPAVCSPLTRQPMRAVSSWTGPDRPFQFAIDIAVAHYGWRIEPQPLDTLPGASMSEHLPPAGDRTGDPDVTSSEGP